MLPLTLWPLYLLFPLLFVGQTVFLLFMLVPIATSGTAMVTAAGTSSWLAPWRHFLGLPLHLPASISHHSWSFTLLSFFEKSIFVSLFLSLFLSPQPSLQILSHHLGHNSTILLFPFWAFRLPPHSEFFLSLRAFSGLSFCPSSALSAPRMLPASLEALHLQEMISIIFLFSLYSAKHQAQSNLILFALRGSQLHFRENGWPSYSFSSSFRL